MQSEYYVGICILLKLLILINFFLYFYKQFCEKYQVCLQRFVHIYIFYFCWNKSIYCTTLITHIILRTWWCLADCIEFRYRILLACPTGSVSPIPIRWFSEHIIRPWSTRGSAWKISISRGDERESHPGHLEYGTLSDIFGSVKITGERWFERASNIILMHTCAHLCTDAMYSRGHW